MTRSHSAPTRTLPAKPSLVQLRKQAKDLLKAFLAGDSEAITEVNRFEDSADRATFTLVDAQRILARAYGFTSWTTLKEHVDGLNVEALCAAVETGNIAAVRKLAKARPELVNRERGGGFGESLALHFAVLNRDSEMTRVLLGFNADARAGIWPHRDATTAYAIARDRGYDEIVAIIEQAEARRRAAMSSPGATVSSKTDDIQQAILEGRLDDAIRILESDLTLIGACNIRGTTPLHVAAWSQQPEMIAWLLERQASVDARDGTGKTPLDYAAHVAGQSAHGRHFCFMEHSAKDPALFDETVRLLRSHGAVLTPRAAVATGDKEAVLQMHGTGRLQNDVHMFRGGLLAIAVRVNRLDILTLLLDLGLDADETIPATENAPQSWGTPLWFAALCGRQECAELLLNRGADPNSRVLASGDPLGNAMRTKDDAMQALLLRHGAHITVEQIEAPETVRAVLEGKLVAHSLNVDDPTPTDLAEQMLWAAGGEPEHVRLCLPYMKRSHDDPWWNYVLMHAKEPAGFQLILQHGINPDVGGGSGYTILQHLATQHVEEQSRVPRPTMLLDAGASLTLRDPLLKSTPLGWACRWGRRGLVELYLQRGADAREPDAEPWATPLAWATKGGHQEIIELLRAHGAE